MYEENDLMEMVKQGDHKAYEELVSKYRKAGIAFAYQIIRDEYLAEDVVQDCFARIYILREKYKNTYSFKTYLFALIKNRSIDYLRMQKATVNIDDFELTPGSKNSIEQLVLEKEDIRQIYRQLEKIQGDYKQVLYLYAIEDLSYEQIAKVMKQTTAQVRVKIYRARQKLKLLRTEEGGIS